MHSINMTSKRLSQWHCNCNVEYMPYLIPYPLPTQQEISTFSVSISHLDGSIPLFFFFFYCFPFLPPITNPTRNLDRCLRNKKKKKKKSNLRELSTPKPKRVCNVDSSHNLPPPTHRPRIVLVLVLVYPPHYTLLD